MKPRTIDAFHASRSTGDKANFDTLKRKIDRDLLARWLDRASRIRWDDKTILKRLGKLVRLTDFDDTRPA